MNSSYGSFDYWEGWDDIDWSLLGSQFDQQQPIPTTTEDQPIAHTQVYNAFHDDFTPTYIDEHFEHLIHGPGLGIDLGPQTPYHPQPSSPTTSTSTTSTEPTYPTSFDHLPLRSTPPDTHNLQTQLPRFEGDIYTAPFIKGEGINRAGWCGFCSSWHRLKDSAFWYHMHFSHGILHSTGHQLPGPGALQWSTALNAWTALCQRCENWLALGKGDKAARTAYYRHAYQCYVRANPEFERGGAGKGVKAGRRG